MNDFNNKYCNRTRAFAISLCQTLHRCQQDEVTRVIIKQIVRSGTSVAANFRATTRSRSRAEYYSKLCIVVEECDETEFWLGLLIDTEIISEKNLNPLRNEAIELLKIFSVTKKKLKGNKTS